MEEQKEEVRQVSCILPEGLNYAWTRHPYWAIIRCNLYIHTVKLVDILHWISDFPLLSKNIAVINILVLTTEHLPGEMPAYLPRAKSKQGNLRAVIQLNAATD